MPLPPIQFRPVQKRPSVLEQVFLRGLGRFAETKLIDEPFAEKREEAAIASREDQQAHDVALENLRTRHEKEVAEFNDDLARGLAIFTGVELPGAREEAERDRIANEPVDPSQTAIISFYEDFIDPETQNFADPTNRTEAANLISRLESLADIETRREQLNLGRRQLSAAETNQLQTILSQTDIDPTKLPKAFIKDRDETGALKTDERGAPIIRELNGEETAARALSSAFGSAKLRGFENDPIVQQGLAAFQRISEDIVPVPAFDPEAELNLIGSFSKPGDEQIQQLRAIQGSLAEVGLASAPGPDGEDGKFWFIDDLGNQIEVKSEQVLHSALANRARSRLRGVLWADYFNLRDPAQFKAAQRAFGLTDPVSVDTWKRVTGQQVPSGGGDDVVEEVVPTPTDAVGREEFVTPGAAEFVQEANKKDLATFDRYVDRMSEDNGFYDLAVSRVEELFALPDDELRTELERLGMIPGPPFNDRRLAGANPLPNRDRERFKLINLLELARIEVEARRRRAGEQSSSQ